jgi:simple sugar transport system ATP-binding protein
MTSIIEMRAVSKSYRGVSALTKVDFDLRAGEVHALIGENGAGKSTLTKIMAGVARATDGEMLLDGKRVDFTTASEALRQGIVMVFQETSLVPTMTVAQNLFLGEERLFNRLRGIYIAAQQHMQSLNFNVDPWAEVSTLGAAKKQMVEIARAVHQQARVIIFDEPTASLTPEEKRHFFSLVRTLKERGVSIIFITHALEEALTISDRITILRDGHHVLTDAAQHLDRETIIRHMVGRTLINGPSQAEGAQARTTRTPGAKVLSVQNLSMSRTVKNNSFTVYAGQVTGIFGLIGSGRTETAKIIAGGLKRDFFHGGEVLLRGRSIHYRVPRQAVRDGIVYVTEDRKLEGFFDAMSVGENIQLGALAVDRKSGRLVRRSEALRLASHWGNTLNVRSIDARARVVELSGGNQQKVVIAKSLVQRPELVIFDEPTRGVDVGAIAEIHQLIGSLADKGLAVVVISSYLPEVMNVSGRILVCRGGRIVEEFAPHDATEERIMFAAVH